MLFLLVEKVTFNVYRLKIFSGILYYVTVIKISEHFLKFKLSFLVWLGLKVGTALVIIFVVHRVRTSSKVHLVDLRFSNGPGDSLGTPFLSSTVQENGV